MNQVLACLLLFLSGQMSAGSLYFPDLERRIQAGDSSALREVLAKAVTTSPGEQLEDLAWLSSLYVKRDPRAFLLAQADGPGCFGVSFLGVDYVDKPKARAKELAERRKSLMSVSDKKLATVKARCIGELAGS
ncbi:MAG TPA: hypothetical protein VLC71_04985 [Thermomonas sp.]|nr:hypothetical protein [Thermomonas sp.]